MRMRSLVAYLSVALIVALWPVPHYAAQQPTAEQIQAYEAFRLWITPQFVGRFRLWLCHARSPMITWRKH